MIWTYFLEYDEGKLKHLTLMSFAGYRINNGNMSGLTQLQKYAILVMDNERLKWAKSNKAIPSVNMG